MKAAISLYDAERTRKKRAREENPTEEDDEEGNDDSDGEEDEDEDDEDDEDEEDEEEDDDADDKEVFDDKEGQTSQIWSNRMKGKYYTNEHLNLLKSLASIKKYPHAVGISGRKGRWEALMKQEDILVPKWEAVYRKWHSLRLPRDQTKIKKYNGAYYAKHAKEKSDACLARRMLKDKPDKPLTEQDCVEIWNNKMTENPEFYERLVASDALAHPYAHQSGDHHTGMTNQTFEGSGAARGTGLSGFHKRATEAKIGVYDWILPSRRVLLLATDLESYNWRLLEKTATSQLESLGFTFSTRTQLGTMINMRRGGGHKSLDFDIEVRIHSSPSHRP